MVFDPRNALYGVSESQFSKIFSKGAYHRTPYIIFVHSGWTVCLFLQLTLVLNVQLQKNSLTPYLVKTILGDMILI